MRLGFLQTCYILLCNLGVKINGCAKIRLDINLHQGLNTTLHSSHVCVLDSLNSHDPHTVRLPFITTRQDSKQQLDYRMVYDCSVPQHESPENFFAEETRCQNENLWSFVDNQIFV